MAKIASAVQTHAQPGLLLHVLLCTCVCACANDKGFCVPWWHPTERETTSHLPPIVLATFPPLCWQVCGGFPDALARTAQLIDENISVDFVDVNMGEQGSHHRGLLSVIQLTHLAIRHLSLLRTKNTRLSHLYCVRPQRRQRTAAVPPAPLYTNFP